MPRLTDFNPQWIDIGDRKGLGLLMDAPAEKGWRLFILFANPLDGGAPWPGESRSANAHSAGHFTISNGGW